MAAYGITASAVQQDLGVLETAFSTVQHETITLNAEIANLRAEIHLLKTKTFDKDNKLFTEKKGFERLSSYNGEEKSFGDWEFKLHQFVRAETGFERYLDKIKELEVEPKTDAVKDIIDTVQIDCMSQVNGDTFDDQLYNLLSMLAAGPALTTVKNVRETHGCRGSLAWHRITRDVAGKSGHRLERLLDRVHHPPKISTYANAEQMLMNWQAACIDLEKLEKQLLKVETKVLLLHLVQ